MVYKLSDFELSVAIVALNTKQLKQKVKVINNREIADLILRLLILLKPNYICLTRSRFYDHKRSENKVGFLFSLVRMLFIFTCRKFYVILY